MPAALTPSQILALESNRGALEAVAAAQGVEAAELAALATSDDPLGPFTKSPLNPVINSGHETCMFPFKDGVAALVALDGPEKNTIQWSPDGEKLAFGAHIEELDDEGMEELRHQSELEHGHLAPLVPHGSRDVLVVSHVVIDRRGVGQREELQRQVLLPGSICGRDP